MSTAIRLKNAKHVILDNVTIRGFQKGILAENSQVSMRGANIIGNVIGLEVHNSDFIVANSILNNSIDILLGKNSEITIIDTIARQILDITKTPSVLDPKALEINWIAHSILSTKDLNQKKMLLKSLKKKIESYYKFEKITGRVLDWILRIYSIIKILQDIGIL